MRYELFVSILEVYNEKTRDLLVQNNNPTKKLEIKQAKEGTKEVLELVEVRVCDTDAVWKLLKHGSRVRSTNANQLSSPSHWNSRMTQMLQSSLANLSSSETYCNFSGGDCKTLMIVQINTSATILRETLSCLKFANRVRGIEHGPARKRMDILELFKYKQQVVPGMLIAETTKSWDEMGLTLQDQKKNALMQSNIVVAVIDSGICMQSESFSDEGITPLEEAEFRPSNDITFRRNNKVVAANCYYLDDKTINIDMDKTITDYSGHGTGCASVISGRFVDNVSYGLIKKGEFKGGVPGARLSIYKLCQPILIKVAVAEAVTHGAHILSMSISEPEKKKVLGKRVVHQVQHIAREWVLRS
ncbi:subtilisin-like protease SBT5.5 [Rhododendron vialii]|uniref:subtilisin-like protease SBT5.5 n=1 Tax=Rhododendron vialii TaxID=182163 RepID=UPI00265DCCD4|nr:subtilisin-like protease SBT5.5 [Rhododendron vialii]